MSPTSSIFKIQEHTIPTAHIREYPRALAGDPEDALHLAIKQYTPRESASSNDQRVTVIGAHANGFPKELYEPLWEELYHRLKAKKIHINSIWIADVAHQGQSGIINERDVGNDPSWADHPRDLFLMVNHFRKHMKRPLIGIGHSMGGTNLVNLSLMHSRLFTTLILIDPVILRLPSQEGNFGPAKASVGRREIWPSRKAAAEKLKSSKFYQLWDPRVLDRWIQYGLRELPTYHFPYATAASSTPPTITADPSTATVPPAKDTEREVTLSTTKHQEVFYFARPNFPTPEYPNPSVAPNPLTNPDVDPDAAPSSPFYNPVPMATFKRLPNLRPSVFYIFGDPEKGAHLSDPMLKADRLAHTGVGVGGSGGVKKGRVSSITYDGIGHLIPMEVVERTADDCVAWLKPELDRWRQIEEKERAEWAAVPKKEKSVMSDEYVKVMKGDWEAGAAKLAKGESKL